MKSDIVFRAKQTATLALAAFTITCSIVFCIVVGLWITPISAQASGFDPVYYAERYPDVANAVGTSQKALIQHYLDFGIWEGRYQNAAEEAAGTPLATYIDIDLENQDVKYILENNVVFEAPCVSGDVSKDRETPTGVFAIYAHIPGQFLTGPTWRNWVDYWMPFSPGGCGLHDATWRRKFGGTIYMTNGSHGCVNLSHDDAKTLFDMVGIGTVVIVH